MIFVTVGTQLPFPRLIGAMDCFAGSSSEQVIAQTGEPIGAGSDQIWPNLETFPMVQPEEFTAYFGGARVVVAHAGIGTILSAIRFRRPLVVLPRKAELGEHRNDHQIATARQLDGRRGLYIAWEVDALAPLLARTDLVPMDGAENPVRDGFLAELARLLRP